LCQILILAAPRIQSVHLTKAPDQGPRRDPRSPLFAHEIRPQTLAFTLVMRLSVSKHDVRSN